MGAATDFGVAARGYFDHHATTPLHPLVVAAMARAWGAWGNPSSLHARGRDARDLVERARDAVAALVGGDRFGVVFTSGGTESNQLGIVGGARAAHRAGRPARVVTSGVEHPSVRSACEALEREGFTVETLPVDASGRVDLASGARAMQQAALFTLQVANHETGVLEDVAAWGDAARQAGCRLHLDAVQGAGRVRLDAAAWGADSVAVSAHKVHGPKGVGALWVRGGVEPEPLWPGAGQERGRRPGTENVPGIVGFGTAAALAVTEFLPCAKAVGALRDQLEAGLLSLGAVVNGAEPRLPHTSNVSFMGVSGELLLIALDLEGIQVSSGAACSSGRTEPSPVLLALGASPDRAKSALRFGLGVGTTEEEVTALLGVLPRVLNQVRET